MKYKIHLDNDPYNNGTPWASLCGRATLPVIEGHNRFIWMQEKGWYHKYGTELYCKLCLKKAQLHILAQSSL